jgi:hypothetical protein
MAATVRIEPAAHEALSAIARAKKLSLTEALSRAIETYRREVFVSDLAADFAILREDVAGWAEEASERDEWERTTGDGLPIARGRGTPVGPPLSQNKRSRKKSSPRAAPSRPRRR